MASKGNWTVIFEDKKIVKNFAEGADEGVGYKINDDAFWNQSKFSNIWAIQLGTSNSSDEVEHRDETPHSSYEDANLGDISQFSNKWDVAHLAQLQIDWDEDVISIYDADNNHSLETQTQQIARKGERPTTYSS